MSSPWQPPAVGDIVWCHFPELPTRDPGPKPRPALVVNVEMRDDGVIVGVAYGTSKRLANLKAGEFATTRVHAAAFQLAGLGYDTKFDCKQVIDLPWSDRFFKVPPHPRHGQTPKLGTLHPSVYHAAKAAFRAGAR
ncbi:MAG TPA: type II toxin-antitoxin system PemK/MazF family toxin [Ramlibacter sp.]|uniref:type II toxin-antitoxin system PemK/MazF family toxin n=1 Tax=Ramlibacter sp. TaxID=1917967 RepID=UPI002BD26BB7|nr:type II toxin-antitoxin system PemK/MazF family toxin [Ramlibacter sp.]HVZ45545.1 type II toxin-antitoxin system PemK/MazF family toxin [Ramlibacter sp.]